MPELLIATKNNSKIKELKKLLANLPVRLKSLNEFPDVFEPEETEATFAGNACLKARFYALRTGIRAVADDSGLEVKALNGAPGVYSARYAGEFASDAEKIDKVLRQINETGDKDRRARFVCVMAIADESGKIEFTAEGVCDGTVAQKASGSGGFGYDPIFVPDGLSVTFGELPADVKQQISHRARASSKIIQYLRGFYTLPG